VIAHKLRSIAARIAAHAAAAPNNIAVTDSQSHLTYADLDRRSSALAALLRQAGAAQDCCVGVLVERSSAFVIAALAIMKSGAAYLPIDASTPVDRIATILADAETIALLTSSSQARTLPPGVWHVIELDGADDVPAAAIEDFKVDPSSLAYVIYTSGSTGQPKGVEITHASLCNLVEWHLSAFDVTTNDRASQVANFGFDAAGWEIWPYLAAGANVLIVDDVTRRSPETLRDWIVSEKITIGFVPTAIAEQLIRMNWPAESDLRVLLTGGDMLRNRPIPGLPFAVINNYGPTECTVVATSGLVAPEGDAEGTPSIGRPIPNALAFVLDDESRPVAPGQPGELCLGGAIVGRGYRNRRELTARQFVEYAPEGGQSLRVYRTGDRARLLENGEVAYLGRMDDQVKVRGYRIELGEIAAHLNRFPGVEASIAAVRDAGTSSAALVAYVVAARDAQLSATKLREFLTRSLPDYMIPALFVSIAQMPVTVNGKLDKAALPEATADKLLNDASVNGVSNGVVAEANGMQRRISALVASILGRPSIDANENFFMLGGHSMLGVELVARIRDTFGVKLTLRQLFTAPTVAALSNEVARLAK